MEADLGFKNSAKSWVFFLWRACKNFIPVGDNLCQRGMGFDPSCPLCGCEKETFFHALIMCPAALASWFVSPLGFRCDQLNGTFAEWFDSLKKHLDEDQLGVTAMVAWSVWCGRMQLFMRGKL